MVGNENFSLNLQNNEDEQFNLEMQNEDTERFTMDFGEVINVGGGSSDFNELSNRPKYNSQEMTGNTNIPAVPTKVSSLENDSDYQTSSQVASTVSTATAGLATKDYVDSLVGDIETALHAINNGGSES